MAQDKAKFTGPWDIGHCVQLCFGFQHRVKLTHYLTLFVGCSEADGSVRQYLRILSHLQETGRKGKYDRWERINLNKFHLHKHRSPCPTFIQINRIPGTEVTNTTGWPEYLLFHVSRFAHDPYAGVNLCVTSKAVLKGAVCLPWAATRVTEKGILVMRRLPMM